MVYTKYAKGVKKQVEIILILILLQQLCTNGKK